MRDFSYFGCLLILVLDVQGQGVLDQSFTPVPNLSGGFGTSSVIRFAQTFTPGVSGRLTGFDVYLRTFTAGEGGAVPWAVLRTASNGTPLDEGGAAVAAGSFVAPPPDLGDTFVGVRLGGNAPLLSAGDVYALRLLLPNGVAWWGQEVGTYERGSNFNKIETVSDWLSTGADYGFKTYMTEVPEPSSYLVVMAALGVLGLAHFRSPAIGRVLVAQEGRSGPGGKRDFEGERQTTCVWTEDI